ERAVPFFGKSASLRTRWMKEARNQQKHQRKCMERSVPMPGEGKFALDRQAYDDDTQWQASLMDLAYDAIIVRDPQSRVLFWNRGAEQLYGYSAKEAMGQITHELLQTRFPESGEALDRHLATGELWQGELVHTCKDGTQVFVESRQTIRRNARG